MKGQPLYAGMGRAQVEIDPSWLPMEHFGGAHDAPCARALLLKAFQGEFLLLSLELTSLIGGAVEEFKAAAASAAGISPERVWVSVTHTFAVPHFLCGPALAHASPEEIRRGNEYKAAFLAAAKMAVAMAARSLRPAALAVGSGASAVNANRDIETPQGWWIGIDLNGLCDRTVDVMRVDGLDGSFIGLIYHYAMQSSVLDHVRGPDGTSLITADLVGETSRVLERRLGGTAIFLPGASGDQCPRERARFDSLSPEGVVETIDLGQEKGFAIAAQLGAELAADVGRALGQAGTSLDSQYIAVTRRSFPCPKQIKQFEGFPVPTLGYRSIPDGTLETSVEILRIGREFAAVGVLPELNCVTGLAITRQSPVAVTWVAQMINGGQKYMVDETAFKRGTYGAMNGFFGPGAAEELVRQIREGWAETF